MELIRLPEIRKNSFYRSQLISGAVALNPRLKDFPSADGDTTYELKGGVNPKMFVLSGNVAKNPAYGAGTLKGGWLRTFCTGLSISGSAELPKVDVYNMAKGVYITEPNTSNGWAFPSTIENNIAVYSSQFDPDEVWLGEYFDGADKSLGALQSLGNTPGGNLALKDVYLEPKEGAEEIFIGGDAFLMGMGESNDVKTNLKKYFSYEVNGENRVYVRPVRKNRMKGLWTATIDGREGASKWAVYTPFWKWKKIQPILRFGSAGAATNTDDIEKDASTSNTIFGSISKSGDFNNPLVTDSSKPFLESIVEISTAKAKSGGSSLRMYHQWSTVVGETNSQVEKSLGKHFINPQVAKACVYDLPAPLAQDLGTFDYTVSSSTGPALDGGAITWTDDSNTANWISGSTRITGTNFDTNLVTGSLVNINNVRYEINIIDSATLALLDRPITSGASGGGGTDKVYVLSTDLGLAYASGAHLTDKRIVFPEIDVTCNISKLYPSPAINPSAGSDYIGTKGRVYARSQPSSGSSTATLSDADIAFSGNDNLWKKGGPLTSLLRSFVITFSSYPPDKFDTLDAFIDYGMNQYYMGGGDTTNNSQFKTQLAGVVFQRSYGNAEAAIDTDEQDLGIEQNQDVGSIYAYALPVTTWGAMSGSSTSDDAKINTETYGHYGLYASGGMALIDNSADSRIGGATRVNAGIKNIVVQPKYDADYWNPDTQGTCSVAAATTKDECINQEGKWTPTPWTNINGSLEPHWVKIPMDDFFNMRFVFDKYNSYGGAFTPDGIGSLYGMGGTYSHRNMHNGNPTDYSPNSSANKSAWGVPLRVYFEGNVTGSTQRGDPIAQHKLANAGPTGSQGNPTAEQGLPYINIPFMWYPQANNQNSMDFQAKSTRASWNKGTVESYPRYMTFWLNNYRYTTYEETSTNSTTALFYGAQPVSGSTGGIFGEVTSGDGSGSRDYKWQGARREGADEIAFGNASDGADETTATEATEFYMSPEAEVFLDNIEFKYFNHSIVNHSVAAGEMSRFINFENNKMLSPRTTYTSNDVGFGGGGSLGADATPITAVANSKYVTGFRADGRLLPHNPGLNLSIGFKDDPSSHFPISGTNTTWTEDFQSGSTHDIYLLHNNFSTSQFGRINQISPSVAWKPTAGRYSICVNATNYAGYMGNDARGRVFASGTVISGGTGIAQNRAGWAGTGYTYSPAGAGWAYQPVTPAAGAAKDGKIAFGSGANTWMSGDGLTQKGFVRMSVDTSFNAPAAGVADFTDATCDTTSSSTDVACDVGGNAGTKAVVGLLVTGSGIPDKTVISAITGGSPGAVTQFRLSQAATATATNATLGFQSPTLIDRWSKSPNSLVSAKIIGTQGSPSLGLGSEGIIESPNQIRVDSPQIFAEALDDTYLIYKGDKKGAPIDTDGSSITTGDWASSHLGYVYTIKLAASEDTTNLPSDIIELVVTDGSDNLVRTGVLYADDGTTLLCDPDNISELWISPLRYWMNYSFITDELDYRRSYEAINAINKAPASGTTNALGSTYNEWLYSYNASAVGTKGQSGFYEKPWILGNADNSTFILNTDYGYGTYDEETDKGGQVGQATAVLNQYVEADISGIIPGGGGGGMMGGEIAEDEGLNFAVTLNNASTPKKVVTLVGDDTSEDDRYKPTLIWEFHDPLPTVSNFAVSPAFNALTEDISLYELTNEDLNAVKFTWEEEGEDVWYRLLMVDTEDIKDKYHSCIFHMPLNTTGGTSVVGNTVQNPIYKFYDYVGTLNNPPAGGYVDTGSSASTTCLTSIEGLSGYAFLGTGADTTTGVPRIAYNASATANASKLMTGLTEYTFVLHSIPASTDGGNYMFDQGSYGATTGFEAYLDSNQKVVVKHRDVTLQGTSTQICDGETPLNVIVTYMSGSSQAGRQQLELYVNGALEDYSSATTAIGVSTTSGAAIGAQWQSSTNKLTWDGLIEEILIYNKRWDVVPDGNEYIYNTQLLTEKTAYTSAGKWQTNNAKLFLFDYHNIRGRASDLVCQSNLVGWRFTTI